jgi:hypothetical protein
MSKKIGVEKYINLDTFADAISENATAQAVRYATAQAVLGVQVDSGQLRQSITGDEDKGEVSANTPYAFRQEFGPASGVQIKLDPNRRVGFGYTPFLRPAAQSTARAIEKDKGLIGRIIDAALRRARII